MSDVSRSPALGLWEFSSVPAGIECADAIVKGAPIEAIYTGTTHPGKYVVLVTGDTASVEVAGDIVRDRPRASLIDSVFLPDIAQVVVGSLLAPERHAQMEAEAVGVVETATVAAGIDAADAAVKHADVALSGLRLADGLGGKAYFIVDGTVGEVQAAVAAANDRSGDAVTDSVVIPQLTPELRDDIEAASRFIDRVGAHGDRS
ncbi:MAG: BMC domain-containing protein [Acidimicrobiia bacterium]|nr:MAG: BMC domain-containing protein [Acidimicrobiia bacterium]